MDYSHNMNNYEIYDNLANRYNCYGTQNSENSSIRSTNIFINERRISISTSNRGHGIYPYSKNHHYYRGRRDWRSRQRVIYPNSFSESSVYWNEHSMKCIKPKTFYGCHPLHFRGNRGWSPNNYSNFPDIVIHNGSTKIRIYANSHNIVSQNPFYGNQQIDYDFRTRYNRSFVKPREVEEMTGAFKRLNFHKVSNQELEESIYKNPENPENEEKT